MSYNIVPFPQNSTEQHDDRRSKMIAFLRDLASDLEATMAIDGSDRVKVALAFFITDGSETDVQCGGFRDDQAAIKYLSAFIRNQGFAP